MPAIPKRVILYTNMLYWKFYEEKLARFLSTPLNCVDTTLSTKFRTISSTTRFYGVGNSSFIGGNNSFSGNLTSVQRLIRILATQRGLSSRPLATSLEYARLWRTSRSDRIMTLK